MGRPLEKSQMKRKYKPEYAHYFNRPLVYMQCRKCHRGYYFSYEPKRCHWPECKGEMIFVGN